MSPAVSVILPAYNAEAYLDSAIASICAQTFKDYEFLIVNDGSTDGTEAILRSWEQKDARLKVISRPNTGYVKALIEMVDKSSAPLIARMDADDLADPQRLARQVAFMAEHPDVVLLGGAYQLIDEHTRYLTTHTPPPDNDSLQQICLTGSTPICHPLSMFRRDAYVKVGGYDESFCPAEDLDLWLRLGEVGQLAALPDVLLKYRMHAGSVSEKKQGLQVANMQRACENAWKRRGITGEFKGGSGWRAKGDQASQLAQTLKFGWWAFMSGEKRTAMSYGVRAIRIAPLKSSGWRLVGATLKHIGDTKHAE